ncbi:MAG: pyrimidine 5'-nucleotidase [Sphingopyxis sp.]|jgi:putative hydrolase of the HAD superfamily|nr:pyrimidine 5'-nucleotidase [Sphingopyxis sp.]
MLSTLAAPVDPARYDCWIFDLDNCLYPAGMGFFAEIDRRIAAYVRRATGLAPDDAYALQKQYFHRHGTTLAGLMADHLVDPDDYLRDVHDVDMSQLSPDPTLAHAIAALPGQRYIFTNGDGDYALRVLDRIGLTGLFVDIIDIRAAGYHPKPQQRAYDALSLRLGGIANKRAIFFDDMSRNLKPAHAMGIDTVWVDNQSEAGDRDHDPAHVTHHIDSLAPWLNASISAAHTASVAPAPDQGVIR